MFRLDKRKIFLLYQYYLLGEVDTTETTTARDQTRVVWLNNCLTEENFLQKKIAENLKEGWDFSRLPPLERAVLIYAAYELIQTQNSPVRKMIIDQTINFSKAYLEAGKHKYINKNLDLFWKSLLK